MISIRTSLSRSQGSAFSNAARRREVGLGQYRLSVISDNHLCNKQARLDGLSRLHTWFADNGIETVLNAGNDIDGEASFNKHEVLVHGMDAQVRYLGEHYPQRKELRTLAISGDHHEGWYCQREGIDIGGYVEETTRRGGGAAYEDASPLSGSCPPA